MADALWTKEFPTVDGGFYWRRLVTDHSNAEVGQLIGDTLCCADGTHSKSYRQDWEYLGPITPADAERLTSLRAAAQAAIKVLKMEFPGSIKRKEAIAKLEAALSPRSQDNK